MEVNKDQPRKYVASTSRNRDKASWTIATRFQPHSWYHHEGNQNGDLLHNMEKGTKMSSISYNCSLYHWKEQLSLNTHLCNLTPLKFGRHEEMFLYNIFYWPQLEVTTIDLMNLKQQVNVSTTNFVEMFRKKAEKCYVQFRETEYAFMIISGMYFQLKDKMEGEACNDLNEVEYQEICIEWIILENITITCFSL